MKLEFELESSSSVVGRLLLLLLLPLGENSELDKRRLRVRVKGESMFVERDSMSLPVECEIEVRRFWERVRMESRPGVERFVAVGVFGLLSVGVVVVVMESSIDDSSIDVMGWPSRVRRCVELRVIRFESI